MGVPGDWGSRDFFLEPDGVAQSADRCCTQRLCNSQFLDVGNQTNMRNCKITDHASTNLTLEDDETVLKCEFFAEDGLLCAASSLGNVTIIDTSANLVSSGQASFSVDAEVNPCILAS